jgi:threonine synthase
VTEAEIVSALRGFMARGFFVEPTTAAAGAGLSKLIAGGIVSPEQTTIVILTGSGLKAVEQIGKALGLAST